MGTLKVKSWDPEQGDHVIIEEENFDPSWMEKFDPDPEEPSSSSSYAQLTVAELKAELDERGIKHDSGMRKAELLALLDANDQEGG